MYDNKASPIHIADPIYTCEKLPFSIKIPQIVAPIKNPMSIAEKKVALAAPLRSGEQFDTAMELSDGCAALYPNPYIAPTNKIVKRLDENANIINEIITVLKPNIMILFNPSLCVNLSAIVLPTKKEIAYTVKNKPIFSMFFSFA